MHDDSPNQENVHLNTTAQRMVALVVFACCTSLLIYLSLLCRRQFEFLSGYRVEGLAIMFLLALGMATASAPFFAESMTTSPADNPKDLAEALKLYIAVTGITFIALCVVFLLLWLLGWIRELCLYGLWLFKRWLLGPAPA